MLNGSRQGSSWGNAPISLAPNPVQCHWTGPNMSDFDCDHCVLGYETTSETNATCVKPAFRAHRGWAGSESNIQLQPLDSRGDVVLHGADAETLTLLMDHTYTIPAPKLFEQQNKMFVGYAQPYSKIHYELDFSLGAEVDIGCGTSVVGNGANDANIPKSVNTHPSSMNEFSFNFMIGVTNLRAEPPVYGYYPERCPRYHRFAVTRPGNFTFDTCSSMMATGIGLYKRTNASGSAPRMTSDWDGFKSGQLFEVPLHENDLQYRTVTTGLVKVESDSVCPSVIDDAVIIINDPDLPRFYLPDHANMNTVNGCPLSMSAHRTYHLLAGEYFLETQGATVVQVCDNFNVSPFRPSLLLMHPSIMHLCVCVCVCVVVPWSRARTRRKGHVD